MSNTVNIGTGESFQMSSDFSCLDVIPTGEEWGRKIKDAEGETVGTRWRTNQCPSLPLFVPASLA